MNYVEQFQTLSKEAASKTIFDALNSKAMDALSEMQQLNEIMDYIDHNGEHIATNGKFFKVGMKLKNGKFDNDEAAHFDSEDAAKDFIDGGKKGPYRTVASTRDVKRAIDAPTKIQAHERSDLHKVLGLTKKSSDKDGE